jgi:hypothetical protein
VDDFSSARFQGMHTVYGDPNDSKKAGLHILTKAKETVELSAPVVVGAVVLELAKAANLRAWYGGVKARWPGARLVYHDTDSHFVVVKGEEGEDVVGELKKLPFVDGAGTKEPGLLKIEAERITEMVCLGKKIYSCKLADGTTKVGAAGIPFKPSHEDFSERLQGAGRGVSPPRQG